MDHYSYADMLAMNMAKPDYGLHPYLKSERRGKKQINFYTVLVRNVFTRTGILVPRHTFGQVGTRVFWCPGTRLGKQAGILVPGRGFEHASMRLPMPYQAKA